MHNTVLPRLLIKVHAKQFSSNCLTEKVYSNIVTYVNKHKGHFSYVF